MGVLQSMRKKARKSFVSYLRLTKQTLPLPPDYTFDQIYLYAQLSQAAYKDESEWEIPQAFRSKVYEAPKYQGRVLLFFDDKEKKQYISCRGSSNMRNFIEDGHYFKEWDKKTGLHIHRGFLRSTREIYDIIYSDLHKDYETFVTGHSLGGAEAILLHMFLYEDGYQVKQTITFGQPKVTNREGIEKYQKLPLLRVVDENDLVPLVPPLTLISMRHGAYRHFGEELILHEGPYYTYLHVKQASRFLITSFWNKLFHRAVSIKDHFMVNYLERIEAKLEQKPIPVPYTKPKSAVSSPEETLKG